MTLHWRSWQGCHFLAHPIYSDDRMTSAFMKTFIRHLMVAWQRTLPEDTALCIALSVCPSLVVILQKVKRNNFDDFRHKEATYLGWWQSVDVYCSLLTSPTLSALSALQVWQGVSHSRFQQQHALWRHFTTGCCLRSVLFYGNVTAAGSIPRISPRGFKLTLTFLPSPSLTPLPSLPSSFSSSFSLISAGSGRALSVPRQWIQAEPDRRTHFYAFWR